MTGVPTRGGVCWCELPELGRRPLAVLSRDGARMRQVCDALALAVACET